LKWGLATAFWTCPRPHNSERFVFNASCQWFDRQM